MKRLPSINIFMLIRDKISIFLNNMHPELLKLRGAYKVFLVAKNDKKGRETIWIF